VVRVAGISTGLSVLGSLVFNSFGSLVDLWNPADSHVLIL
jgi:hypothetical protein